VSGNPGKRPLNVDEPQPVGDLIEPPEWMSESQKDGWRYAIENAPQGLLKKLDRGVFQVWVIAEDAHREAAIKVAQYGQVIKAPITGTPMQSPYMAIQNKQAQVMMKAASELGFSPTSRSRVKLSKSDSKANRFADLQEIPD
jgi:P27 family predicted phage terminase small subunit